MTFLGWTRLHATWIKTEVVATKINIRDTYTTGSSRLDPGLYGVRVVHICVFWALVCPCQLFVRLWYRVSDVLDLSLVSKRFGFWPHITHVIVLTLKEIKHLSDYRTIGLSDYRSDPSTWDCYSSIITKVSGIASFFVYTLLLLFHLINVLLILNLPGSDL